MKDVYEECPVLGNSKFLIRLVQEEDTKDLLKVYSDKNALPFLIVIIVMGIISIMKLKKECLKL